MQDLHELIEVKSEILLSSMKSIFSAVFCFIMIPASKLHASIEIVAPTSAMAGSFRINDELTYVINQDADSWVIMILDEAALVNDHSTQDYYIPSQISYILNGISGLGVAGLGMPASITDNANYFALQNPSYSFIGITEKDSIFAFQLPSALKSGDILTITPNAYTILPASGFNPTVAGTFVGNTFLVNNNGSGVISDIVSADVPETSSIFMACGGLIFASRRQRK